MLLTTPVAARGEDVPGVARVERDRVDGLEAGRERPPVDASVAALEEAEPRELA